MMFKDRKEAGKLLAKALAHLKDEAPVIVGLPRGGVPVAFEGANVLNAPLDLVLIRKIDAPVQPALAIGAIVDNGIATGATIRAAIEGLRQADVVRLIVAVPVAPRDTADALRSEVDEFVCLVAPKVFDAAGSFYEACSQKPDETVIAFLNHVMKQQAADAPYMDQAMEYEKAPFFS
jgi:predicted phosphoribosyltransferase